MEGEGLVHVTYHMNDVSVFLGRQKGERSPIKRMGLRHFLVVSVPSTGVLNIRKAKNVPLLVQDKEHVQNP